MERKSFAWVWAGVGVAAVLLLVASGVWRQPSTSLNAPITATPPIIVEPIQPTADAQLPSLPAGSATTSTPEVSVAVASAAGASSSLPAEGAVRIRAIQQALQGAGYAPGAIDGKMGQRTQKAIREFQEAHGLSVDGKVGPKTWAKLESYLPQTESSAGN
ncbi:MAG: hypothetical protein A3C53_00115 [Omnitrophica WOR_2 bacterium RIFCSPHIGHO2_02_FULL_68_15]|nr:MAG: hypothetical protein A3C53_00115 [Omnitrophica WOR_2 bacterium RIFCSPHIGHO2_02_FULL_68_15]